MTNQEEKRYLIVNADDFGQSPGVNRGIIEAHERGIVTSASLMVRWPAAAEAATYGRKHPSLSLGLHFDFGEWRCHNGNWIKLYEVVSEENIAAVAKETSRQLAAFRRLIGEDPTHLDSHQHLHGRKPLSSVFIGVAERLGIPLRSYSPQVRYCGSFYGQTEHGTPLPDFISVGAVIKLLAQLPPGFTELGCHPGYADDLDSMYRQERVEELRALRDPRVQAAINEMGVKLCSFRDVVSENNGRISK
jgi:predicted glycoside hydrolase/deacetylase ChbG (UPF0249 family)